MGEVCGDVQAGPALLPINGNDCERGVNIAGSLAGVCQQDEKEKDKYSQGVVDMERSSFGPLVFAAGGRMAPECNRVNKKLAEKIAEGRREPWAFVMTCLGTGLRFALSRSTLIAIQGFRGKRGDVHLEETLSSA